MKNRHGMTSLLAWLLVVAMCICGSHPWGRYTERGVPFPKRQKNAAADGALPERIPEEIPTHRTTWIRTRSGYPWCWRSPPPWQLAFPPNILQNLQAASTAGVCGNCRRMWPPAWRRPLEKPRTSSGT